MLLPPEVRSLVPCRSLFLGLDSLACHWLVRRSCLSLFYLLTSHSNFAFPSCPGACLLFLRDAICLLSSTEFVQGHVCVHVDCTVDIVNPALSSPHCLMVVYANHRLFYLNLQTQPIRARIVHSGAATHGRSAMQPAAGRPRAELYTTTTMDTGASSSDSSTPKRPIYQVETTGSYWGDVREAFKVSGPPARVVRVPNCCSLSAQSWVKEENLRSR